MDELLEAGHRLRTFNPEPTPAVTDIYKRSDRRHRRRVLAWGVSAVVLLAAAGGVVASILSSGQSQQVTTAGGGASLPRAAKGTASITVTLGSGTAVAGTPIQGVVTVDNNTGKPISVPNPSCWGWRTVVLADSAIGFSPNSELCCARQMPRYLSGYPAIRSPSQPPTTLAAKSQPRPHLAFRPASARTETRCPYYHQAPTTRSP